MGFRQTQVRYLHVGDVLAGSGFVVTRAPARLSTTPKGKVTISGRYPNGRTKADHWNPSTTVQVVTEEDS